MKFILTIILALLLISSYYFKIHKVKNNNTARQSLSDKTKIIYTKDIKMSSWIWISPDDLTENDITEIIEFSEKEHISILYVNIEKYLDISAIKTPDEYASKTISFEEKLSYFIRRASAKKITVQALAGNPKWIQSEYSKYPVTLLGYVFDFNEKYQDTKFSGFNFDIEYYNLENYAKNSNKYSENYLSLVTKLYDQTKIYNQKGNNFELGLAIPFWLDQSNGNFIFYKIADLLNKYNYSYLNIMAYRNYAEGVDGTINIVKDEINYADTHSPNLSLFIAQETDNGDIPKTTYYGRSKKELKDSMKVIADFYKNSTSFKGFAIHHLLSYKNLKDD